MKKPNRPVILAHKPTIIAQRIVIQRWPGCEADLRTPQTIAWHLSKERDPAARQRMLQDGIPCRNQGSYTIDGHWYCSKHAGMLALEILAVPAEET